MSRLANYRPMPRQEDRINRRATQPYAVHERNPAGSKLIRRHAKAIKRLLAHRMKLASRFEAAHELNLDTTSRRMGLARARTTVARWT